MDRTVGPYHLGETIGTLPFGELVAATHPARSEPLAVLLLDDRLGKDIRLRGLLRLEIARSGGLRHPSLARTIEIGESGGALYLVIERPAGATTLASRLDDGRAVPAVSIASMLTGLAAGLDAAHERRVVHGAIDPSCVLLGEDDAATLAGVGIMTAVQDAGLADVVIDRRAQGYTAPEQQGGSQAVASADGYALGVLADNLRQSLTLSRQAEIALALAVGRQRSAAPDARFPTCGDFAKVVATALAGAGASPTAAAQATEPVAKPIGPTGPSRPVVMAAPPVVTAPETPPLPLPLPDSQTGPAPWALPPEDDLPALSSPAAPSPELPWDIAPAAASATPSALDRSASTAEPAREATPPPPTSAARRPSPHAAPPPDLGSWIREIIDPPRAITPAASATDSGAIGESGSDARPDVTLTPGPTSGPVTTISIPATPAMLDLLRRLERTDPLGDVVRWATRTSPSVAGLLDQHCPEGRLGPVPVGIAAASVLALLMLLAGQIVMVTAVVALVVVLYGVPRIATALTRSERLAQTAVRVTGLASLKRRQVGPGWITFDLELGDDVTLNVGRMDATRLEAVGHAVTVERPSSLTGGTETVTVEHQVPGVTVTYLAMSRMLLDVRDASGAVLIRHPRYDGEPGDRRAEGSIAAGRQPSAIWTQTSRGQAIELPIPDPIMRALERESEAATRWAWLVGVAPLMLVLFFSTLTELGGLVLVMTLGLYLLVGIPTLDRLLRLRAAVDSSIMTRVVGPVTALEHADGKSRQHRLLLENGDVLRIDAATHASLARTGELRTGEDTSTFWDDTRREHLIGAYEIPAVTVSYLQSGPLILEIVNPFGQVVYRDAALRSPDHGDGPPRA